MVTTLSIPHISAKPNCGKPVDTWDFTKKTCTAPVDIEGQQYFLKPMNCPFHVYIYKNSIRSYREPALRYAEEGTVYRYERSGVLHGLMRVRGFTQDDAHHFCRPDQMPGEIDFVLSFSLHILAQLWLLPKFRPT